MARIGRSKSATGIYHIMLRGNNKQKIFYTQEDYQKFLELLNRKSQQKSLILYAWCLMPNHVHLLLKEKNQPLGDCFRELLTSFVTWYNRMHERVGHVFQDRYKSEPVEDQTYFLRVFRYIHRNPLAAGLCEKPEDYPYSSYMHYFCSNRYQSGDMILNLMRKDELERYHLQKDENEEDLLDIDPTEKLSEEEIIAIVEHSGFVQHIASVKSLPCDLRTKVLQMMYIGGISYRRIGELTGVSISVIRAACKRSSEKEH